MNLCGVPGALWDPPPGVMTNPGSTEPCSTGEERGPELAVASCTHWAPALAHSNSLTTEHCDEPLRLSLNLDRMGGFFLAWYKTLQYSMSVTS